jgi:hypothetical protein
MAIVTYFYYVKHLPMSIVYIVYNLIEHTHQSCSFRLVGIQKANIRILIVRHMFICIC